jgi:hypothetical protein
VHAVINALYVDVEKRIEVSLGSMFELGNLGDAGAIHQNVDAIALENFDKCLMNSGVVRNIAMVGDCLASRADNFALNFLGLREIDVQEMDTGALGCECFRDGAANTIAAAGDDDSFMIQPKIIGITLVWFQSETPLFQGMKSS